MFSEAWTSTVQLCSLMLLILSLVFQAVGRYGIFQRAGIPGWKGLIPLYSTYVQYHLTWNTTWFWVLVFSWGGRFLALMALYLLWFDPETWLVLMILPDIGCILWGLAVRFFAMKHLANAFGRGIGFCWGLFLLEPVFLLILNSEQYSYQGNNSCLGGAK